MSDAALNELADRLKELAPTLENGDKAVISEAAEMLRAAQTEMWQMSILLQSYRVVIQDTGNRS